MKNEPMKILLIEDDFNECNIYQNINSNRKDINIVAITNSSIKGIEYLNRYKPEAIILDLELNNGEGSGFDFIERVKKQKNGNAFKIVITTNVYSDSVYDFLHRNKVDFIFCKKQSNYSQENVINTLLLLRDYKSDDTIIDTKIINENEEINISNLINKELDLIGVGNHLQGRKYLHDAIVFIIKNNKNDNKTPIIQYLVNKYKKSNSTISRAMQNAILHAWRISPLEDLSNYYTARINYETGVPTPTEFIYYYADKIAKI